MRSNFPYFQKIILVGRSLKSTQQQKTHKGFEMDVEDYFIIALVFAIVAFLGNWISYGYFFNFSSSLEQAFSMFTFNTAVGMFIILPSAFLSIAFVIGGIVKAIIYVIKRLARRQTSSGK
jgi:hypothetical protein